MTPESTKDLLGILAAVVALASAWITYLTVKRKTTSKGIATLTVAKIEDPCVKARSRNMRYIKWLGAAGTVPLLVLTLLGVASGTLGLKSAVMAVSFMLLLVVLIAVLRTHPPSRTRKSVSVEVLLPVARAMDVCLRAVTSLGAQVAKYDAMEGILIARTGSSFRSFGEIVAIKGMSLSGDRCRIDVESDAVQVTILIDWGANRRNVRRIQSALLTARDDSGDTSRDTTEDS